MESLPRWLIAREKRRVNTGAATSLVLILRFLFQNSFLFHDSWCSLFHVKNKVINHDA